MTDAFRINAGSTSPGVERVATADGVAIDLTSASAPRFLMRKHDSSSPLVDASATIVTPQVGTDKGRLRYSWSSGDTDVEGEYRAWFKVTVGGKLFELPEFIVYVDEHSPGDSALTGAIADRVKGHIPVAWNALKRSELYGERLLQQRIDYVKFVCFSTVVSPSVEASVYDPFVLGYLGKLATVQIIPAAADYWSDASTQVTRAGTTETASYPDRIAHIWKVHERLVLELARERPEFEGAVPTTVRKKTGFPKVADGGTLMPSPLNMGAPFASGVDATLPWTAWS